MAFNYDSSSFLDTNNNESATFDNDLDAFLASNYYTQPMRSGNVNLLQAPGADDFRTPVDLSTLFKNYNPPSDFEAPLDSPELPKIDTSLVDLNSQDTTYTNTDYTAQPDFDSDASYYQPQPSTTSYQTYTLPSSDKDQAYNSSSFNVNRAYPSSYNGNQGNFYDKSRAYTSIYDVNQTFNSVYDVNQPFSSVAPLPSQLDFTPRANFNSVPTWGVAAAAAPSFGFAPHVPQAGGSSAAAWSLGWSQFPSPTRATSDMPQWPSVSDDSAPSTHTSSASPEVASAPSVPLAHSSLGSARRSRRKATHGPYASARGSRTKGVLPSAPSGLVRDCPSGYCGSLLPATGREALSKICPSVYYCYMSDSHGCCVAGCPEAHGHYTRAELWTHMKTHPEIMEALKSDDIHRCPIKKRNKECTKKYKDMRSFEKHIENAHVDMHVLCPFCLLRQSRQENIGRHFESCATLRHLRPAA
ncbi:hypothetical protein BDZ89DRAFT_1153247 [Hymenopellis radicata]|nr:hypothetical protein BDZ89DRAFT_1153247 [Hymenopellis radicata]